MSRVIFISLPVVIIVQSVQPFSFVTLNLIWTRSVSIGPAGRSAVIGLFDIAGLSSPSPSSSYRRYSMPLVQGHDVNFPIEFCSQKENDKHPNDPLTVTGRVAVAASQAGGTRHSLPHTVTHGTLRAGGGRLELVHHEAAAVPDGDVELPHAALPVLVDAGGGCDDALQDAGHGPCNSNYRGNYRNNVQTFKITICGTRDNKWNVLIMEIFIVLITFIGSPNTLWISFIHSQEMKTEPWQLSLSTSLSRCSPRACLEYEVPDATSNAHSSY